MAINRFHAVLDAIELWCAALRLNVFNDAHYICLVAEDTLHVCDATEGDQNLPLSVYGALFCLKLVKVKRKYTQTAI